MSDLDVTIGLDASDAERGAQTVRRSLQDIKAKATELNTSLTELGRSQRTIDSVSPIPSSRSLPGKAVAKAASLPNRCGPGFCCKSSG